MKMIKTVEFQGLRFKTSFNFRNVKSKDKYFDNLLIESRYKYQEKLKEYFAEKLHVTFSYFIAFKFAAWIFLGIALLSPVLKIFLAATAIVFFITSLILNRKFQNNMMGYTFAISIAEMDEIMEEVRQELINENNK